MDNAQLNPVDYAKRVLRYFKDAPPETRVRESVNFVESLASVDYWPGLTRQSQWIKDVIGELEAETPYSEELCRNGNPIADCTCC
jgi:hypothetical protein